MASQNQLAASEPEYAAPSKQKTDSPFYLSNIDKYLLPETQSLLEEYSKIPKDQQSKHVHDKRDKAWAIRTYPCTGLGVWLVPYISRSPAYWSILERLKAGETFVDVGCFLGMDIRRIVFDGAPSSKIYAVDIVNHWDVGFKMFNDKDKMNATFIEADFLSDDPELLELKGKMDIVSISAVLHQYDWAGQVRAAKRLVEFSMPGSMVVGHQIGNINAREITNPTLKASHWAHDPDSFVKLWDQVGRETGTTWETKARNLGWEGMDWDRKDMQWLPSDATVLDFVVTRSA